MQLILHSFAIFLGTTVFFGSGPVPAATYEVQRLNNGEPIISRQQFLDVGLDGKAGGNINGPAIMRVPQWLKDSGQVADPQANYYLYFAHHRGDYIRMAWAEDIEGPWTLYQIGSDVPVGQRGVLDLGEDDAIVIDGEPFVTGEVASPFPVVEEENQRIILYFHGIFNGQKTFAATSADGLNFNMPDDGGQPGHGVRKVAIAHFYLVPFNYQGQGYGFTNYAQLWRSPEGSTITDDATISPPYSYRLWKWTTGPIQATHDGTDDGDGDAPEDPKNPRHVGVRFSSHNPDELHVFYTRRNDAPERVLLQKVDLTQGDNWEEWTEASWPPEEILRPETEWEGADHPITVSENGSATGVRQLRDPHIFEDLDGRTYLFYTGSGEEAIGVAELIENTL